MDFTSLADRLGYTSVNAIDRSFPYGTASYSIDKIRFDLLFRWEDISDLLHWLDSLPGEMYTCLKAFTYKYLFRIDLAPEVSFQVGVGWNDLNEYRPRKGFLEFNPNKVVNYDAFLHFYANFFFYVTSCVLKRWDLAVDITAPRERCRMEKDQRSYSYLNNRGVTEYLGQRSSPWRCKLYDKQRESGLDVPLTRFEMTIDGFAPYHAVVDHFPKVYVFGYSDNELALGLNETQLVLCELLSQSLDMDWYFKRLGRKTRQKLEPYLYRKQDMLKLDKDVYDILTDDLTVYGKGKIPFVNLA